MCETLECASLTVDVMLVVLEVWQAILVKKLDLDSSWVKQSMSEGARNLLKVGLPCPFFTPSSCLSSFPVSPPPLWLPFGWGVLQLVSF